MKTQIPISEQETFIRSNHGWFYMDWRGLFRYSDLLILLVKRDFIAKYKQTLLGPLWFILQPLATALVFFVIFGKFSGIPTNGVPPVLFYLCGLLAWAYFAQSLNTISLALVNNAYIFEKVYFPRLIVPFSIVISNGIAFAVQLTIFLIFYFYYNFLTPSGAVINSNRFLLVLPFLMLQTAAISLGVGLCIASVSVKYRDFHHLVGFMTQLWMYATPIIYPMSMVPEKWRFVFALNPMAVVVESYRYAFFGIGYIDLKYLMVSVVMTLLLLAGGLLFFNRVERSFVDTI